MGATIGCPAIARVSQAESVVFGPHIASVACASAELAANDSSLLRKTYTEERRDRILHAVQLQICDT